MELIKKTINRNILTGGTVNFTINLIQEYDNLGYMTDFSDNLTLNSGQTNVITGFTENKLNNIRSYDYSNPYKVGINGVTKVTDTQIFYTINEINYITNLSDLKTTFQLTKNNQDYISSNFMFEEKNINLIDKMDIDNSIFIERQNISIIENFSKIRQISSVTEIENFNNGFYKIFDQTI